MADTTFVVELNDGCSQAASTSLNVHLHPNFDININSSEIQCFGTDAWAEVIANPSGVYTYEWTTNPINFNSYISIKSGDFYSVKVSDGNGCQKESSVLVPSYEKLKADFTISPNDECLDLLNAKFYLIDQSTGVEKGQWNFGDTKTQKYVINENIYHIYEDTGTYIIRLKVENGGICSDFKELSVCITPKTLVIAPTAFSPNNDQINDIFHLHAIGIGFVEFSIFNRWGEEVFQSNNIDKGWDGNYQNFKAQEGNYTWQAKFHSYENNNTQLEKGTFQLIR